MGRKPIWTRALLHFPTNALSFSSTTNQPTYTHLRRVPSLCKCALPFSSLGTHPLPPLTSSSFPPLRFPLSSGLSSMHHLHHLDLHHQAEHHHGHHRYYSHPCSFLILKQNIYGINWSKIEKKSVIYVANSSLRNLICFQKQRFSLDCVLYICDGYGGRNIWE